MITQNVLFACLRHVLYCYIFNSYTLHHFPLSRFVLYSIWDTRILANIFVRRYSNFDLLIKNNVSIMFLFAFQNIYFPEHIQLFHLPTINVTFFYIIFKSSYDSCLVETKLYFIKTCKKHSFKSFFYCDKWFVFLTSSIRFRFWIPIFFLWFLSAILTLIIAIINNQKLK